MAGYDALIKALLDVDDKASPKLKDFQKNIGGVTKSLGELAKGAAAGLGVALSVGAFASLIKGSIDAADEIGKLSQKIGLSVEDLSTFKYAAAQNEVGLDQLKNGFKELNKSIVESQDASTDAATIFKSLGVETKNTDGSLKSSKEVFLSLSDVFAGLKDDAAKSELAVKLFGRAGVDMIPFLNQGSKAIKDLQEQAKLLGLEISTETSEAADEFNDTVGALAAVISGSFLASLKPLLPILQAVAEYMLEGSKTGSGFAATIDVLAAALKILLSIAAPVVTVIAVLIEGFVGLGRAAGAGLAGGMEAMSDSFKTTRKNMDNLFQGLYKFEDKLWSTQKATVANTNAQDKNNNSNKSGQSILDGLNKSKQKAAETERKLTDEFNNLLLAIQKEKDGYNLLSKEEQVRYDIAHGKHKQFSADQQQRIEGSSKELDTVNKLRAAYGSYLGVVEDYISQKTAAIASAEYDFDTADKIRDAYETGSFKLNGVTFDTNEGNLQYLQTTRDIEKAQNVRVTQLEQMIRFEQELIDNAASLKQVGEEISQAEKERADKAKENLNVYESQLKAVKETMTEGKSWLIQQRMSVNANIEMTNQANLYKEAYDEINSAINESRQSSKKHVYQWELLNKLLETHKISIDEYDEQVSKLIDNSNTFVEQQKEQSTEITEFWKAAAQSMQGAMSDFFFDVMQGNLTDLVGSFKRSIDRMVADLLASQLATYLLGSSFGKGGDIGGLVGSLFGGFRAAGGEVNSGTSYIVGEKGPELFTPTTNGNITPNGMMGNVSISISALDGADVMKVLSSRSREIANMVTGTRYANNLR